MDADDLRLFTDSLRQAASGDSFEATLAGLGWRDALADEPTAAAAALFAVQGELNLSSAALDDVLINALGLPMATETAIVLPAIGGYDAPGTIVGDRVIVRGLGSRRLLAATTVVVVVSRADEQFLIELAPTDLEVRAVTGMDPAGGWVEVSADVVARASLADRPVTWAAATTAGQLALAQELTTVSRAMLALARDHAAERIQFGRPIGKFQAVRHRLADCLLAVESADAAVGVGWAQPSPFSAAMAKAIAGRSAKTVARHAQQVLAGMGFTSEHAFHLYMKRAMMLDQLLGSGAALSEAIGNQVLATGQLPSMLAL